MLLIKTVKRDSQKKYCCSVVQRNKLTTASCVQGVLAKAHASAVATGVPVIRSLG